ncbi:MAG: DsbE family thiol:disulfide interchange protein [Hyphomicrobiales bacterium]|nr:DsbE family thiol:disulfide interchange protein [Hyphomicrobiales bacterium]PCH50334.1 MAG: DsbE family thiol:disulfide interchange protein [Hyphomicrobiales bacterium]
MSDPMKIDETKNSGVKKFLALIPLFVFLALAGIFYKQLVGGGSTRELPSALIGKPAPIINLPILAGLKINGAQVPALSGDVFKGKVTVLNVFASWCGPCRIEHPQLMELSKDSRIQMAALNYKDAPENALRFLGQLGNPYTIVGVDEKGRAAIEWGVYGVPETYVIGKDGIIRFKHVGPISDVILNEKMKPLIEQLLK